MRTIDEISIGRDGDMFTLTIYHYGTCEGARYEPRDSRETFLIGLPDQLHAEVQRTIGEWLTPAVDETPTPPDKRGVGWPYSSDALTHDAQGDTDQ